MIDWHEVPRELSLWISGSYPRSLSLEAHTWRRVAKVGEENGEVIEALLGAIGENPRKGLTHRFSDVERELYDVALTALGAAEHMRGNDGGSVEAFKEHMLKVAKRAGL
jgi:hypothetical protein